MLQINYYSEEAQEAEESFLHRKKKESKVMFYTTPKKQDGVKIKMQKMVLPKTVSR